MIDADILAQAEAVLTACRAAGLKVATAESCTGGLVAGEQVVRYNLGPLKAGSAVKLKAAAMPPQASTLDVQVSMPQMKPGSGPNASVT